MKELFELRPGFTIIPVPSERFPELSSYDDLVGNDFDGYVIDFQLDEIATANYNGLDIANHLQRLTPGRPIAILTGHPANADRSKLVGRADLLIDKQRFSADDTFFEATMDRILRLCQRYEDALTTRDVEYDALIHKKMEGPLSPAEEQRFAELRHEYERPVEQLEAKRRDAALTLNQAIKKLLHGLDDLDKKVRDLEE